MTRIYIILAGAHASMVLGAVAFYMVPSWPAGLLLLIGFFLRWMVPLPEKRESAAAKQIIQFVWLFLLLRWLVDKGLFEVFEEAILDRLSLTPIALATSFLIYWVVVDWVYVTNLRVGQIDKYYERRC